MLNIVLQTLADYGVDDVHLIVATSLHRRMTEAEIRRMVGERAFKPFWPDRLYNFDAENRAELVMLGKTDHGEEVWLSKRAAESDLLIYLNINLVPMDGGHKSVAVGLAPYQSLRHHHNPATLRECNSYMDPTRSALHRIGRSDGPDRQPQRQRLHDRDRDQQPHVRRDARLPAQERGPLPRLGPDAAQGLSLDARQPVGCAAPPGAASLRRALFG